MRTGIVDFHIHPFLHSENNYCHYKDRYALDISAACDTAVACLEVLDDRRTLEALFDRRIHGLAYPNGSVNAAVESLCRSAGIWYARTTVTTCAFDLPQN